MRAAEPDSLAPKQQDLALALVQGEPLTELPKDLYIPPAALQVILNAFEGPLDLLLYLIRRQNLNILDINVASITEQYMQYVELMNQLQFELAGEYLLMAATLAEIKSRMLLPKVVDIDEDEQDPRAELVRRLLEYEQFKRAAQDLDELPRMERDSFAASAGMPELEIEKPQPEVELDSLLQAFGEVLKRAQMFEHHHIQAEQLSTRERMSQILERLGGQEQFVAFAELFSLREGRLGVVVTLLAVMELIKESLIELVQAQAFAPIHVRARQAVAQSAQEAL